MSMLEQELVDQHAVAERLLGATWPRLVALREALTPATRSTCGGCGWESP